MSGVSVSRGRKRAPAAAARARLDILLFFELRKSPIPSLPGPWTLYSSDCCCVYTFTPLLNETGRICLKTAHVAATKPGVLIMRVPFRSALAYRPCQRVVGRAEGSGRGWGAEVVAAHSRDSTASSPW